MTAPATDVEELGAEPFRVLSLDGGGMRGIYTASVLHGLGAHFGVKPTPNASNFDVGSYFDLVAGTSTGGILACGLAYGQSTSELISLYEEVGKPLFKNPTPKSGWGSIWWAVRNSYRAANKPEPLRSKLESIFEDANLGDLYQRRKIAVCVPASRMMNAKPKVFKTPHIAKDYTIDPSVKVVDVCMATSAAPIFLPVAEILESEHLSQKGRYADGGLWANNPALIALIEALKICSREGQLKRPIQLLSVGTSGGVAGEKPGRSANLGSAGWKVGVEAANMSIELQGHAYHYMTGLVIEHLRALGQDICYARIPNPHVNEDQARTLGLDRADASAVGLLKSLGHQSAQDVLSICQKNDEPLATLVNGIFDRKLDHSIP